MITVIADDITGAAEIAGIAQQYQAEVIIMALDSRSMLPQQAKEAVKTAAQAVRNGNITNTPFITLYVGTKASASEHNYPSASASQPLVSHPNAGTAYNSQLSIVNCQLFKKVDSALRGNVEIETEALLEVFPEYTKAVYMPANPSKERVIVNGLYYIKGEPLSNTAFAHDPEFPVTSSLTAARFPNLNGQFTIIGGRDALNECTAATMNGDSSSYMSSDSHIILLPDAATFDDIKSIMSLNDGTTLFMGAADLFTAFLQELGYTKRETAKTIEKKNRIAAFASIPEPHTFFEAVRDGKSSVIIVQGSTQSKPVPMSIQVARDDDEAKRIYATERRVVLAPKPRPEIAGDRAKAIDVKTRMTATVADIVKNYPPANIIIEGGATAYAIFQQLGWKSFSVIGELAPGVVQLQSAAGPMVTLKPGSYPWN